MNAEELYRNMMSEVHAPSTLKTRLRSIPMEKTAKRKATMHLAAVAMASVMSLFVVSNGVAFAVTGETWVEKAIVIVNGEPREVDVTTTEVDGKKMQSAEFTVGDASVELEAENLSDIEIGLPEDQLGADMSYRISTSK